MAYLHIVIVVRSDSATSVTVRCQYIHPVYGQMLQALFVLIIEDTEQLSILYSIPF